MFRPALWCCVVICLVNVGCGRSVGVQLYPTSGKVVYQGKPVVNCLITLIPNVPIKATSASSGVARDKDNVLELAFTGKLDAEGKFQLASSPGSKAGAAVGKYKVVLTLPPEDAKKAMMSGGGKKAYENAAPFPKEYSSLSTSKKEVEITAGKNELLIDL